MALSGSRLKTALTADIYTQLQSQFPINSSLLAAEKTYIATAQQDLANAIANAVGPDTITEITGNAVAAVTGVTGVTTGSGTSGPSVTGTVS